jgi:hypothetical protein
MSSTGRAEVRFSVAALSRLRFGTSSNFASPRTITRRIAMLSRTPIGTVALIAALATAVTSAAAFDESKYPD